jgi:hypothetical protein
MPWKVFCTLLTGNDEAYVVAYDDKVYKLSELVADSAGISAAFDKPRKHQPVGSTALYDAIKAAAGANFGAGLTCRAPWTRPGHTNRASDGGWPRFSSEKRICVAHP